MSSAEGTPASGGPVEIDHVQLAAPPGCEAQARAFYGGLLGLREVEKPEPLRAGGGVWFVLGANQIHIGVADPFTPARKAHPALRMADEAALETLAARLQAAGAHIAWDTRLSAVRRFFADDPWGNRLELLVSASRR